MSFPKVLIFGQPFNNFTGGGITLSNLFRGWPGDKIAVTYIGHGLRRVTTDICDTYYQLGMEEHKWMFPFNLFQRKFESGIRSFDKQPEPTHSNPVQGSVRTGLVNRLFYPFLHWSGLYHVMATFRISGKFKKWLSEYRPDILYLQIAARNEILFAGELIDYLKIPAVIHIMDDWPSALSRKGLFRKYWEKRINQELKGLMSKMDLHLSISDEMAVEYKSRYGKDFKAFHNPIETDSWLPFTKTDLNVIHHDVLFLYNIPVRK